MYRWLLDGAPRPVQMKALEQSYGKTGWGHWLEMRLGKTATALNEFAQYIQDYDMRYMLVLAPNKFKPDWILAAQKWGLQVPMHEFNSSDEKALTDFVRKNAYGLVAVNYEALVYKKNVDVLKQVVGPQTFIVADESIKLKNPNSKTYKMRCASLRNVSIAARCRANR